MLGTWQAMRAALEAALADVPEPAGPAEALAEGFAGMVRQQQARIADLEAKLGSVRKWREEYDAPTETRNGLSAEAAKVLDAILNGERVGGDACR